MSARKLWLVSLAALGLAVLPATGGRTLQVKVSINSGPTITGPDNGTLIITASPSDTLRITWALGTDTAIDLYRGLVFGVEGVSGVDTTEMTRVVGSALELTGQGFDPFGNPNAPDTEQIYNAFSDGAPIGFAGNGGELWRIEYIVTNPVTDAAADISYRFDDVFQCFAFPGGLCPGTPGSASLRIDAVPEPDSLSATSWGTISSMSIAMLSSWVWTLTVRSASTNLTTSLNKKQTPSPPTYCFRAHASLQQAGRPRRASLAS